MAVLMAPDQSLMGATGSPPTMALLVPAAQIMPPGPPAIYTRPTLTFPSADQLGSASGGYAI